MARLASGLQAGSLPVNVMGIEFPNPVGVAAGLDKQATAYPALAAMGFGSIEVGTVTPRPQPGNPGTRLFRLTADVAIINRMGFNSVGLERFVANLAGASCPVPLGVNLGKNADTTIDAAATDYLTGLDAVYPYADYVAINVSSPNTPSLRELQHEQLLGRLLAAIIQRRDELTDRHQRRVPIALKIAPDLTDEELAQIVDQVVAHGIDGIIATNTTVQRPTTLRSRHAGQAGGMSGRPLKHLATKVIADLYEQLQGEVPIIGVGGIEDADDAWDKLKAGADLLQLYTSFIFQGPAVVGNIVSGLETRLKNMHITHLAEAVRRSR